jgi:hypothetical protein
LARPEYPIAAALGRLVTIDGLLFSPNSRADTAKQIITKTEVVYTFEHLPPGCRMLNPTLSIGQAEVRYNETVTSERKIAREPLLSETGGENRTIMEWNRATTEQSSIVAAKDVKVLPNVVQNARVLRRLRNWSGKPRHPRPFF